jgi:hypothetical protein
LRIHNRLWR